LAARAWRRWQQKREFARTMLTVHLLNHEGTEAMEAESRLDALPEHLRWPPAAVGRVVRAAERRGLVERHGERVVLTDAGRDLARQALGG
jgi:manganese/zinc/iron transport system permease protein